MQPIHIVSQRKDGESEACKEATSALDIYSNMDASEKYKFLNDFIGNGRGKGKDALKFRFTYQRTATRSKEEKISTTENMLTRHGCWISHVLCVVARRCHV